MTTPNDWADAKAALDRKKQEREPAKQENMRCAKELVAAYHFGEDITLANGFDPDLTVIFDFDGLTRGSAVENIVALQEEIFSATGVSTVNLGGGPLDTGGERAVLQVSLSVDVGQKFAPVWAFLETEEAIKFVNELGVIHYTVMETVTRKATFTSTLPAPYDNDNKPQP